MENIKNKIIKNIKIIIYKYIFNSGNLYFKAKNTKNKNDKRKSMYKYGKNIIA